jgi:hypothetical protein
MPDLLPIQYRQNKFWKFIQNPDEPITLRQYFDNIKNYVVSCTIFGVGIYLQDNKFNSLVCYAMYFVASIAVLFNAAHLFVLLLTSFYKYVGFTIEECISTDKSVKRKVNWKLKILITIPIAIISITWYIFSYFISKIAP